MSTISVPTGSSGPRAAAPDQPRDLIARLTDPRTLVTVALLAAPLIWLFKDWLVAQHKHSSESGDWSHAYLVPFISLFLMWQNRPGIERTPARVFWPGLVAVVTGIVCYLFFLVGTPNHLGQGLSVVLTIFGLVLLLTGPRMMTWLFLPIAYLVFAITMPEKIMYQITAPLQRLAAQGAYITLETCGISTRIAGNVLFVTDSGLEEHSLNVAEQCSGMRMVIGFLALGAAAALVATRMWWKRVVLLALATPVALILNVARVAVLGFAAMYDANLAAGEMHTFIGTLLLLPGLLIYMLVAAALNKAVPEEGQEASP